MWKQIKKALILSLAVSVILLTAGLIKVHAVTLTLFGDITESRSINFIGYLVVADQSKDEFINIVIDTNGGSLQYALVIRDALKSCKHKIRTLVLGKAFSGGVIVASAGTEGYRYAFEHSSFLIHLPYVPKENLTDLNYLESEKLLKETKVITQMCAEILAKDLGISVKKALQYMQEAKVVQSEEAKNMGIIDKIVNKESNIYKDIFSEDTETQRSN